MHKQQSLSLKHASSGALLALLIATLGPASAQQSSSELQAYDVEIIIFQHLGTEATQESWSLESVVGKPPEIPDDEPTPFDLGSSTRTESNPTQAFPGLPASRFKLTAIEGTLRRSRNYRPLAHIGWTQPGYARDSAPFMSLSSFVPASSGVSGQIALSRGRYLHLTLDLTFTAGDSASEPGQYVLRQSRRMRSNERHYIDHPKFGVIAVVTPSAS